MKPARRRPGIHRRAKAPVLYRARRRVFHVIPKGLLEMLPYIVEFERLNHLKATV